LRMGHAPNRDANRTGFCGIPNRMAGQAYSWYAGGIATQLECGGVTFTFGASWASATDLTRVQGCSNFYKGCDLATDFRTATKPSCAGNPRQRPLAITVHPVIQHSPELLVEATASDRPAPFRSEKEAYGRLYAT